MCLLVAKFKVELKVYIFRRFIFVTPNTLSKACIFVCLFLDVCVCVYQGLVEGGAGKGELGEAFVHF